MFLGTKFKFSKDLDIFWRIRKFFRKLLFITYRKLTAECQGIKSDMFVITRSGDIVVNASGVRHQRVDGSSPGY